MRGYFIYLICVVFLVACNDVTVGYLETENAEYMPDYMEIPQIGELDEIADAQRIKNNAPWVITTHSGNRGNCSVDLYYRGSDSNRRRGCRDV